MVEYFTSLDAHIFQLINSHHSVVVDYFFMIVTQLGNGWIAVPLVAIVIVVKTPRSHLAKVLICALVAGTLAGILNTTIKRTTHRSRPVSFFEDQARSSVVQGEAGSGCVVANVPFKVHTLGPVYHRNSFPSGHTATAFTAATILAVLFGGYFFCSYIPAFLVAYSRVYMGDHFPLDTFGGALLGIIVGFAIMAWCGRLWPRVPSNPSSEKIAC
jgi:membrane-associated phospholipid phosphatase